MFRWLLIVLICPALALGDQFKIHLDASAQEEQNAVNVAGNDIQIISEDERKTFQLGDENLKKAVETYFGTRPDDAYLHSPTPWGDLYKRFDFEQVTRTLTAQNARILGLHTEPVIVLTQYFYNNSTVDVTFDVHISQSVTDTVETTWSSQHEFTVGQEIEYKINVLAFSGGGTTSFEYKGQFGKSDKHSHSVTVGSNSGLTVALKPGQSVVAKLTANRGSMQAEVDYESYLKGHTACNNEETVQGHHFWGHWLPAVMESAGISNSLRTTQVINVGFYSDSKIVVEDTVTRQVLLEKLC